MLNSMAGGSKIKNAVERGTISDFLSAWLSNNYLDEKKQKTLNFYYRSYKKHFGPYLKKHYANQTKELFQILSKLRNPKVLEIGFGCGTESIWLAAQGYDVESVDVDPDFFSVATERQAITEKALGKELKNNFRIEPFLKADFKEKFDVIWIEQAFHHLEPRSETIDKLANIVKDGGYIIISETNWWNPLNQIWLFSFRRFNTIVMHNGIPMGNERILPPCSLKRQLKQRGLKPISLRYFRTMPNKPTADKIGFLENIIPGFLAPFFTHYNLVAQKPVKE